MRRILKNCCFNCESFSNDDLRKLVEEQMYDGNKISVPEVEKQKELPTDLKKKIWISLLLVYYKMI